MSVKPNQLSVPFTQAQADLLATITPGHWVIKAYAYCSGTGVATGGQVGISIDSSSSGFSDMAGLASPLASNFAATGNLATQDVGVMINKTVQISVNTTYYIKLRCVGGTGTFGAMMEATRVR